MTNDLSPEALTVIAKVQKLLNLAGNNPNEAEAASASAKAMELLAAYNLDMTTVERNSGKKGGKRAAQYTKGGLYKWQRELWQAVAKLHFCMYWYKAGMYKGSKYEHKILGRHENVISTNLMAEYLQTTIDRLARERVNGDGSQLYTRSSISYREGVAARVTERLNDLRRQRIAEDEEKRKEDAMRSRHPGAATSNALVLADAIQSEEDANNDFLYGKEEGWHAQQRAERIARRLNAEREAEAALRAQEQWELDNPEEAALRRAEAMDASAVRASLTYRGSYYKGDASAYNEGYRKGNDVGLDKQVDHNNRGKIG